MLIIACLFQGCQSNESVSECGLDSWWPEPTMIFYVEPQIFKYARVAADEINLTVGREFLVLTNNPSVNSIRVNNNITQLGITYSVRLTYIKSANIQIRLTNGFNFNTVMKHELIHAIGLSRHSQNVGDLMYSSLNTNKELFIDEPLRTTLRCVYGMGGVL